MAVQIDGSQGNVIATKGTYSGNVTIGGTLTYEDVTNIDAVGIITARSSIEIGARPGVGASISSDGNAIFSGITTITQLGGSPKLTSGQTITSTANDGNASIQGGLTYPGGHIRLGGGSGDDDIRFSVSGGSGTLSEKARITSGGEVLIGTSTGTGNNLTVQDAGTSTSAGGNICARFQSNGSGRDATIQLSDNVANSATISMLSSALICKQAGTETLRIDSSGRLLVGATAKRNVLNQNGNSAGDSTTPLLYAEGVSDSKSLTIVSSNTNAHRGSVLGLARTRATSVGGNTIVADGDNVGQIVFAANDGVDLLNNVATIRADIDASPGANDTPGRLVFSTTADGANVATERLRITSGGKFGFGLSAPTAKVAIVGGTASIPRLAFESGTDDNDFTFSQYEDGNGVYTMIGQNVKLDSSGNNDILDTSHRTAGILFDGRNNGALMFNTGDINAFDERMRIDKSGNVGINESASLMSNGRLTVKIDADKHIGFNGGQGEVGSVPALVAYEDDGSLASMGFRGTDLRFAATTAERFRIQSDKVLTMVDIKPNTDGSLDLGASGARWDNVFTNDLDLSNESKKDTGGNEVDGTWGAYTIQEGENDLFLINRRSGKKYKFNLTEIS